MERLYNELTEGSEGRSEVEKSAGPSDIAVDPPAPGNEPSVSSATVEEIRTVLDKHAERVASLVDERQRLDTFRERQIDTLHAELQTFKADLVAKAIRPAFQSMMRLHDDCGKVIEALQREPEERVTRERLVAFLEGFREDVELALSENGITAFTGSSQEFDARRQTVARRVSTTNKELALRIAGTVRPGFEQGEIILKPERVAIYVFEENKTAPNLEEEHHG